MNLILGAGLAGLSCSYHLGHDQCLILEKSGHAYGHIHTDFRDGFTWDEGPHVSFTKSSYVRELFEKSVDGKLMEYEVSTSNFFDGNWIDHPAQTSLYQIPEPLRSQCLTSFMESRQGDGAKCEPKNYAEWLNAAFGPVFAETFPAAYTRKYWTREPRDMTTNWVGNRVFYPKIDEVIKGSKEPLGRKTHYVTTVRYPTKGGYQAFAELLFRGANIKYGKEVIGIDLENKCVRTADGDIYHYNRLINTIPLPHFIQKCIGVPVEVLEAVRALACSSVLLVNVIAPHPTAREDNWMYVYDENKYSTRINFTEKLAPGNAPEGQSGIQVEVYFSRFRPMKESPEYIAKKVVDELIEMKLLQVSTKEANYHTHFSPWANVIFGHETAPAIDIIWDWLEKHGLQREVDDLHPLTNWREKNLEREELGPLVAAGRFGQWKYYWSDDCVERGKNIVDRL